MGQTRLKHLVLVGLALLGVLWLAEPAAARSRMSFSPGSHGYSHGRHHGYRSHGGGRHRGSHGRRGRGSRHGGASNAGEDGGGAGAAKGGFTLEDGVLTYPAPARFQPKNLKPH